MPDLFTVAGTTFRFPSLPDDYVTEAPELFERFTAERANVLAKATEAKHTPLAKPRPFPRPKAGNGAFTPKPGAPGDVITVDGRDFEVWSPGPYAGTRWVTHAGRYFLWRLGCNGVTEWAPRPR